MPHTTTTPSHPQPSPQAQTLLIWGANGWIAGQLTALLRQQRKNVHTTTARMQDQAAVRAVLDDVKPTHVINCAGKTHGKEVANIDWCEDHKVETIETNVVGTLMLAKECTERGVHLTVLATGCIYRSDYNAAMTQVLSPPFTEEDPANFAGSFYSATKSRVEDILKHYPRTCILRVRMPVSDDLHPRSFVTKIASYARVVDVPNSHSILHDLLPVAVQLAEHGEEGVYNFTNPGAISHNGVLALYREIVAPGFTWENFTVEEQAKVIKADRSNCELDSSKLMAKVKQYQAEGHDVDVPEIHEAYRACFERMKAGMQQKGGATQ